ncbi:MAG: hypothetical protein HQM11_14435 [SAR324 cluster bacterium]|nr:hypothetical protein [SAR324 cluster bacterium]
MHLSIRIKILLGFLSTLLIMGASEGFSVVSMSGILNEIRSMVDVDVAIRKQAYQIQFLFFQMRRHETMLTNHYSAEEYDLIEDRLKRMETALESLMLLYQDQLYSREDLVNIQRFLGEYRSGLERIQHELSRRGQSLHDILRHDLLDISKSLDQEVLRQNSPEMIQQDFLRRYFESGYLAEGRLLEDLKKIIGLWQEKMEMDESGVLTPLHQILNQYANKLNALSGLDQQQQLDISMLQSSVEMVPVILEKIIQQADQGIADHVESIERKEKKQTSLFWSESFLLL